MALTSPERRKLMEEHPTSWRSIRVRRMSEERAKLYWEAKRTGSSTTWLKYELLSTKFARLHAPKETRKK
jgi:hypothetical protein